MSRPRSLLRRDPWQRWSYRERIYRFVPVVGVQKCWKDGRNLRAMHVKSDTASLVGAKSRRSWICRFHRNEILRRFSDEIASIAWVIQKKRKRITYDRARTLSFLMSSVYHWTEYHHETHHWMEFVIAQRAVNDSDVNDDWNRQRDFHVNHMTRRDEEHTTYGLFTWRTSNIIFTSDWVAGSFYDDLLWRNTDLELIPTLLRRTREGKIRDLQSKSLRTTWRDLSIWYQQLLNGVVYHHLSSWSYLDIETNRKLSKSTAKCPESFLINSVTIWKIRNQQ